MPKVTPPRYLPYQFFVLPSFPPSLPHTPGLGTTSPARSSILSCFLAISSSAVCMSFRATYFSSGSVITYGRKSQGSFFRVGSKTRANGGNTMGPLLFWGWGIGWLFVCWRRIGRDGQTVMYVCVCVCVSVRGRSGQVRSGSGQGKVYINLHLFASYLVLFIFFPLILILEYTSFFHLLFSPFIFINKRRKLQILHLSHNGNRQETCR